MDGIIVLWDLSHSNPADHKAEPPGEAQANDLEDEGGTIPGKTVRVY